MVQTHTQVAPLDLRKRDYDPATKSYKLPPPQFFIRWYRISEEITTTYTPHEIARTAAGDNGEVEQYASEIVTKDSLTSAVTYAARRFTNRTEPTQAVGFTVVPYIEGVHVTSKP